MTQSDKHPDHVRWVPANRISTGGPREPSAPEEVCVVEEAPVTIAVEDGGSYTLLCTPDEKREMAAGFLYTEGVIGGMEDVESLEEDPVDANTVRVRLTGDTPRIWEAGRNLMIVSSCGACGSQDLKGALGALPRVGDAFRIESETVRTVYAAMSKRQSLFEACGGTHAAAVFDADGKILSSAEDTGRHTALDKAIGKCLMDGIRTQGRGAALTSRLSMEMVAKCARAGVELITAVSAPTSMAIDLAEGCHITLCAFVREARATVFTHPERVTEA